MSNRSQSGIHGMAPAALGVLATGLVFCLTVSGDALAAPASATATRTVSDTAAAVSDTIPRNFIGKPTAPIQIAHEIAGKPAVGQPVAITLTITPGVDLGGATLGLRAEDALVVTDPVGAVVLGDIAANESVELVVTALPLTDVNHYLGVTVTGTIGGIVQSRNVSVAIRLPGEALRKAAEAPAGNKDETVRSFEAVETVR